MTMWLCVSSSTCASALFLVLRGREVAVMSDSIPPSWVREKLWQRRAEPDVVASATRELLALRVCDFVVTDA